MYYTCGEQNHLHKELVDRGGGLDTGRPGRMLPETMIMQGKLAYGQIQQPPSAIQTNKHAKGPAHDFRCEER